MATLHQPQRKCNAKLKPLISGKKKEKTLIFFSCWATGDNLVKEIN